ncbi:MAG: MBL fold metallo-hydrolase [Verrucomicrobiota bacterium]
MKNLTAKQIQAHPVPPRAIAIWWLGQAGFILKTPAGVTAVVDPYLSDSCKPIGERNGFCLARQVPPPMRPRDLVGLDLYLVTHTHQDHLDPETIGPYRKAGGRARFVAPPEAWDRLLALKIPSSQVTMVWPNKSLVTGDLTVRATFAIPFGGDDLTHVGYLFMVKDGPTVYLTGDTAYEDVLVDSVAPHKPDVLLAVINGAFRNLGPVEAARLAKGLNVKVAIPCHYDMFPDNCQPPQMFRTCLKLLGIGDRYCLLRHAVPFSFSAA